MEEKYKLRDIFLGKKYYSIAILTLICLFTELLMRKSLKRVKYTRK